jgi:hypothetical protein
MLRLPEIYLDAVTLPALPSQPMRSPEASLPGNGMHVEYHARSYVPRLQADRTDTDLVYPRRGVDMPDAFAGRNGQCNIIVDEIEQLPNPTQFDGLTITSRGTSHAPWIRRSHPMFRT